MMNLTKQTPQAMTAAMGKVAEAYTKEMGLRADREQIIVNQRQLLLISTIKGVSFVKILKYLDIDHWDLDPKKEHDSTLRTLIADMRHTDEQEAREGTGPPVETLRLQPVGIGIVQAAGIESQTFVDRLWSQLAQRAKGPGLHGRRWRSASAAPEMIANKNCVERADDVTEVELGGDLPWMYGEVNPRGLSIGTVELASGVLLRMDAQKAELRLSGKLPSVITLSLAGRHLSEVVSHDGLNGQNIRIRRAKNEKNWTSIALEGAVLTKDWSHYDPAAYQGIPTDGLAPEALAWIHKAIEADVSMKK